MDIGVIVPSWHYWANPLKLQPLWELYYATLIAEHVPGANVRLIDLRGGQIRSENLPGSDVYFYWIMKSGDALEVENIVGTLRHRFPTSRHFAGGNHIDRCSGAGLEHFDTVFTGTAERQIIEAFADLSEGRLQTNYATAGASPFAAFRHARRDFLPAERVVNREHFAQHGGFPGTGVYFSRGCSFHCRFCVYNNPSKFEYREPAQITGEIEYLQREYGIEGVNLRDEVCIPMNRLVARGYLEAIGRTGVRWRGQTVTIAAEEMVRLAAESGCVELALGLENVESDRVLEIVDKPSKSVAANRRFIELLQKHGIKVKVCLIFGLPGETDAVLDRTIEFLEEVRPDYVAVSGFDPVPGSAIHADPAAYGIARIDPDLSRHAHLLYRFGDAEDVGLPFEYAAETPFGPGRRRERIVEDLRSIQTWLRERGMSY